MEVVQERAKIWLCKNSFLSLWHWEACKPNQRHILAAHIKLYLQAQIGLFINNGWLLLNPSNWFPMALDLATQCALINSMRAKPRARGPLHAWVISYLPSGVPALQHGENLLLLLPRSQQAVDSNLSQSMLAFSCYPQPTRSLARSLMGPKQKINTHCKPPRVWIITIADVANMASIWFPGCQDFSEFYSQISHQYSVMPLLLLFRRLDSLLKYTVIRGYIKTLVISSILDVE